MPKLWLWHLSVRAHWRCNLLLVWILYLPYLHMVCQTIAQICDPESWAECIREWPWDAAETVVRDCTEGTSPVRDGQCHVLVMPEPPEHTLPHGEMAEPVGAVLSNLVAAPDGAPLVDSKQPENPTRKRWRPPIVAFRRSGHAHESASQSQRDDHDWGQTLLQ